MKQTWIRKPVSVLLSILMVLSVFGGMAFTVSAASSGNFGDLYWTLDDDGLLSFSGNGGIPDYGFDWKGMPIKKIIINDCVTALGDCAFRGCTQLKEVVFESNPTLDWDAFGWCYALEKVTLPQDMETIAGGMFISCTSLKTIELPAALKKIESIAFSQSGLESLTIPEGVEIGENAFNSCNSLTSLILESSAPVSYERGAISTLGENVTVTVGEGCHYDRQARTEYKLTLKEGSEIPEWMSAEEVDHLIQMAEWEFNDAIEEGKSEEEALAAANAEMFPGLELEVHKTEIEAYDQIFRTGDTCPDVFGAATLNVNLDEATQNVIDLINAIGTVEFTDECKAKIDDAREAYDALNDVQKTFVDNYETLAIAEGHYAALQLAADMAAFEAYKTEKKNAMDALAEEGDSEEVLQIIGLAKTQIDYAAYDESMTLAENKAALDALVAGVPAAVAAQRNADRLDEYKAAFADYKNEVLRYLQSLEEPDDSAAAAAIIVNAISAVNDIGYDESKTFAENKAAVDAAADIADALAAQRAADAAAANQAAADEVSALIDAIGDVEYTDESKAKIDEARAAYDALTDEQKALVENYETLTAAEEKYAALKAAAEASDEPDEPENPDEPAANGSCPYCGETHNRKTISGWWTELVHHVLHIVNRVIFWWAK